MSATMKDMVMRLTSHVGAKRVVLLKHKYVDHTQIDFLRGNNYHKASVHLNRSCSRVQLARCQEVLQFNANGFTNLNPEKGKRQLGSRSRSQAILTPVSDPTPTMKKDYLGPEIVSHFVMHGTSVAEIVKHLIAVLKKKNDDVSNIFLEALKRAYHRHMMVVSESNDGSLAGKSFQERKDLAARLSGTFVGAARNKHRSDILKIFKDGIEYAFVDAPKQLSFWMGLWSISFPNFLHLISLKF